MSVVKHFGSSKILYHILVSLAIVVSYYIRCKTLNMNLQSLTERQAESKDMRTRVLVRSASEAPNIREFRVWFISRRHFVAQKLHPPPFCTHSTCLSCISHLPFCRPSKSLSARRATTLPRLLGKLVTQSLDIGRSMSRIPCPTWYYIYLYHCVSFTTPFKYFFLTRSQKKMSTLKRTVLITGCSDGGIGAVLAVAFHEADVHVYATARNPAKMSQLRSLGIETLTLDVQSESSITVCVSKLFSLDILINNAGMTFLMPVVDVNIAEAKKTFDLNVWSYIAMTQTFLPLLLKSPKGMIVNQTSVGDSCTISFQAIYNASKFAIVMISDTLRLELELFGIKVVDLRTAVVKTNLIKNMRETEKPVLPKGSIYEPTKEVMKKSLRQEQFDNAKMPANKWSKATVRDLMKKNPSPIIWRGESAWLTWLETILPFGTLNGFIKKLIEMNKIAQAVQKKEC